MDQMGLLLMGRRRMVGRAGEGLRGSSS
jgi:hypothetical protein